MTIIFKYQEAKQIIKKFIKQFNQFNLMKKIGKKPK